MVNKVILLGNVGADPEVRTFEDGNKVARIRLATTERIFNPKTQEKSERTQWHTVVVWRGLANVVEQYVRKGSQLFIEGKINYTEWSDQTGNKRYGVEIIAESLNMVGSRRDSQQGSNVASEPQAKPANQDQYPHQQYSPSAMEAAAAQPESQPQAQAEGGAYTPDDDDLPF